MRAVFLTRFSFFGKSGWRSPVSTDPGDLFDPDRLEARFQMFEKIALASLSHQTDADFELVVLSSKLMPGHFKHRLVELCRDTLGERAQVLFRPYRSAGMVFYNHIKAAYQHQPVVGQVVLDDDDAVSCDFVESLKYEMERVTSNPMNRDPFTYLSFPRGYTLGIEDGTPRWMGPRNVPYTNLGLTMVGPPDTRKNPFSVSHLKVGQRFASQLVNYNRPYYLRAVHEHNDSRARTLPDRLTPEQISDSFRYFPLLRDYFDDVSALPMAAE